jgi:hypothetical protein
MNISININTHDDQLGAETDSQAELVGCLVDSVPGPEYRSSVPIHPGLA